jgi:CheY-like chemotaxis protein
MDQAKKHKRKRILLVEDHIINQQVVMRMLAKIGYRADLANNGVEAISLQKKTDYDLIIMDCQMPIMDGYRATREIRNYEMRQNKKSIPIIALTAHAMKSDREKCIESGMNDYLAKPIKMNILASTIEYWISRTDTKNQYETATIYSSIVDEELYPVIDIDRLNEIFGDDVKSINSFLTIFLNSTFTVLGEIQNAIKLKDTQSTKRLLHGLKGASGNSGIMSLFNLTLKAEEAVLNEDWDKIQNLYKLIEDDFSKVQAAANEFAQKNRINNHSNE